MKRYKFLFFLLFGMGWQICDAQIVINPINAPESLVACGESDSFQVVIANTSQQNFSNLAVSVSFPEGMFYFNGSLQENGINFIAETPTEILLEIESLPSFSTIELIYSVYINCNFINDQAVGYEVFAGGTVFEAQEQPLGNFFYPEVVITDLDFTVLDLAVGTSGTREFAIIQSTPGAHLDTLFFVNHHDGNLQIDGIDAGVLSGSGALSDTFAISGNFMPGADSTFDFNDTILLTETLELLFCNEANSIIELFWRCGEEVCQNFTLNSLVTPASGVPDFQIVNTTGFTSQTQASNPSFVGGGFCDTLELTYELSNFGEENAFGAGAVYDLLIGSGLNNNLFGSIFPVDITLFPAWTIEAFIEGQAIDLGVYFADGAIPLSGYNIDFSQFNFDPDGAGGLADIDNDGAFDDLPVNTSTTLTFKLIYDPSMVDECTYLGSFPYKGGGETIFRIGYHFRDHCDDQTTFWYSVNDVGFNIISLFTHRSVTYTTTLDDSNLSPGEITNLEIRPDGAWNSPCAATDSFVLEIILPDGLANAGLGFGPGDFAGIVSQNGDTIRLASNERGSLTQPWGLQLMVDCTEEIQDTTLEVSFIYYCAPDCGPGIRIDCEEIILDFLPQCEVCDDGIDTRDFAAERMSLGWTNIWHTENSTAINTPALNLKAGINHDSVAFRLQGVLRGAGPFDSLYAQVVYQSADPAFVDPTLPHFEPLEAHLVYFTENGSAISCQTSTIITAFNTSTGDHTLEVNLEPFFLPGGCLEGITRTAGDSLSFTLVTLVTDNTPRRALPIQELIGEFYRIENSEIQRCNRYTDYFLLEEVIPDINNSYSPQIHYGCESIYFSNNAITNNGHIYDGDQFPDEVRSVVEVSEIRILLAGAWQIETGTSELKANGSFNEVNGISATAPEGLEPIADPLVSYNGTHTVFQYVNDGAWPEGDMVIGGSNPIHNIRFRATPGCNVPQTTPFEITMEADMITYVYAPEEFRDTVTLSKTNLSKQHRAPSAQLLLASPQSYIPNSDTVRWQVRVLNNTSYAGVDKILRHVWLAVEHDPEVNILSIVDVTIPSNNVSYPILDYVDGSGKWIKIGSIPSFDSRIYEITGLYEDCDPSQLKALLGSSCIAYPFPDPGLGYTLAGEMYACDYLERDLFIQPTNVALAMDIISPPNPSPLCEPLEYQMAVSNVQLPHAYANQLQTNLPIGTMIVAGSSMLEYPTDSGNWTTLPNPVNSEDNIWIWDLTDSTNGLPFLQGVDLAPANQYTISFELLTDCDFSAGQRIPFTVSASNSCGTLVEKRAFSEKLNIIGVPAITNSYGLVLEQPGGGLQVCDTTVLDATIYNLGPFPTSNIEFVQITTPATFFFQQSSVVGGGMTYRETNTFFDQNYHVFALPAGVPAGDSMQFSFSLENNGQDTLACTDDQLIISALLETSVSCVSAPQDSCDIYVLLNSDTLTTEIQKDILALDVLFAESVVTADGLGEMVTVNFQVTNLDDQPTRTDSMHWQVVYDQNGTGLYEEGIDLEIYNHSPNVFYIAANGQVNNDITFFVPNDQLCQLLLVGFPTASCMCEPLIVDQIPPPVVRNGVIDPRICSGDTVVLGTDIRVDDFVYEWTSSIASLNLLTDVSINQPEFSAINNGSIAQIMEYYLTTTRPGGCVTSDTVLVTVEPVLQGEVTIASNYNGAMITCFGESDGALEILMNVGAVPYSYAQLDSIPQSENVFEELGAGNYNFLITDDLGCQLQLSGELAEPDALQVNILSQPVTCYDGTDGSLEVIASGGVPNYNYQLGIGETQSEQMFENISSGLYNVSVIDENGCEVNDSIIVTSSTQIIYTIETDSTTCSYAEDGSAFIEDLSGGTPNYMIFWDDNSDGTMVDNLAHGLHFVTVTDAHGCEEVQSFEILRPAALEIVGELSTHVSCFGGNDATQILEIEGGVGDYNYFWSNGVMTNNLTDIPAGSYQVTVTDVYDCEIISPYYLIQEPDALSAMETISDVSCNGFSDGSISLEVAGGTPDYQYLWENGQIGTGVSQQPVGFYSMTITDGNNCEKELLIEIKEPEVLDAVVEVDPPNCADDLGVLTIFANGGTAPFEYLIDSETDWTTDNQETLEAGLYELAVADAQNCLLFLTAEITSPLPIIVSGPELLETNYGDTISASFTIEDARGDIFVEWEPHSSGISCIDCLDPVFDLEQTTVFYMTVIDAYDCETTIRLPVIVRHPRRLYLPSAFSPNDDGVNDVLFPYGASEVEEIKQFQIFDRWGGMVFKQENFLPGSSVAGWDGTFNGQNAGLGVYVYWMEVLFTDGEILIFKGDVVLMR